MVSYWEKKYSLSNSIFQSGELEYSSADRSGWANSRKENLRLTIVQLSIFLVLLNLGGQLPTRPTKLLRPFKGQQEPFRLLFQQNAHVGKLTSMQSKLCFICSFLFQLYFWLRAIGLICLYMQFLKVDMIWEQLFQYFFKMFQYFSIFFMIFQDFLNFFASFFFQIFLLSQDFLKQNRTF